MNPIFPFLLGVVVIVAVAVIVVVFLLAGGDVAKVRRAGQAGLRFFREEEFAKKVDDLMAPPPPPRPSGEALRFLALLQREGRLLDFLLEDVQSYPDDQNAQIGAAVRDIHRKCQAALKEHLVLEPIMSDEEGSVVEVPADFDRGAIRVVGNITGEPPFKGTLQHHGWRAKEIKLAAPLEGQELVLMPAEVEIT